MAATADLSKFKVGLVQMLVGADKEANLVRAAKLVKEAASNGAQVVALPECFNSPFGVEYFPKYAEPIPGETTEALSRMAKESKVYLIGGSIPESDKGKFYNTCTVFNPSGKMLGKYSKMHMFDVDVPGGTRFKESDVISPGNEFLTLDTEWCKIGIGICYDIRFQELASIYNQRGCKLLCYPGAFSMTTGPAHWELLARSVALSNQVYIAAVSPARNDSASYISWGHSMLTDPWGKVVSSAEEKETIIYSDVDLDHLEQVRTSVPILKQKRLELYKSATATV